MYILGDVVDRGLVASNPKHGYQVIVGHTKMLSLIRPEKESPLPRIWRTGETT